MNASMTRYLAESLGAMVPSMLLCCIHWDDS